jgi:hypothetical protein
MANSKTPTHSVDLICTVNGTEVKLAQASFFGNNDAAQSLVLAINSGELELSDVDIQISNLKEWGTRTTEVLGASAFKKKA